MKRREFIQTATAAAAALASAGVLAQESQQPPRATPRKALQFGMLPQNLSDAEKFQLAKKCGFEGIEGSPMDDHEAARKLAALAREAGVPFHSLCYGGWHAPFSSPDASVIDAGLAGMENALRCAKAMGADTVLLVPAVVTESVSYADAYTRSQEHVRKLIPIAEETGVTIGIENVWNKFLLSPLEFARYVDEFDSPRVRAYFDVGNVIIYGFSQHWIRTLGSRICKIHLKDFKREGYQWTNLREGDVNWIEARKALDEIGYDGFMTTELGGGDAAYLTDLSNRIDLIIAGK